MARIIGLDYDHKDKSLVRKAIKHIIAHCKPLWIRLFISPSGRGYHVKFSTPLDYSDDDCLFLRRHLGDDSSRIAFVFDGDKRVYRDVLFDIKLVDGKIMKSVPLDVATFLRTGREVMLNG